MSNLISTLQVMQNNSKSCLAGKIFVHLFNIFLRFTEVVVLYVAIFIPETPGKRFIAFLCVLGFLLDFKFLSSVEGPILRNPFKKDASELIIETIHKEPMEVSPTEELSGESIQNDIQNKLKKASTAEKDDHIDLSANGF